MNPKHNPYINYSLLLADIMMKIMITNIIRKLVKNKSNDCVNFGKHQHKNDESYYCL